MPLRLGYKASAEQFGPNELLDFSILAERRGFDSVFISDHFQPWRHTGGHAPFSMAWMGALGARTSRIAMGTSVLTPTFRYYPAVVAQAFGTLGSMFPGRVILGVGTGESLNEVPATGMAWPEQKERTARLKEAQKLGFMRAIVPDAARAEAPDGFSLITIGTLANLVVDIARDGMPPLRRVGRQEA